MTMMAIMGGLSSLLQSQEKKEQIENQARALEFKANALEKEGFYNETLIRRQKDIILGQQVSSAAGSGVQVGTGSVLDVIEDTAFNIEMDAITTRTNYANQAVALRQEAQLTRSAKPSGLSTLLGVAGAGASGYYSV